MNLSATHLNVVSTASLYADVYDLMTMDLMCVLMGKKLINTFMVPTRSLFLGKVLILKKGVPALEKSLLLNIFDKSPRKVLIFNRCVKTLMINIISHCLEFSQMSWQWRETFQESQRPVNQSPVLRGMTASGSRQNTTCFIHKILLPSDWEPIGRHMMSRGSCMQFDWSTISWVHMAHAL